MRGEGFVWRKKGEWLVVRWVGMWDENEEASTPGYADDAYLARLQFCLHFMFSKVVIKSITMEI